MFSKDEIKLIIPGNRVRSRVYPFLLDLTDKEWATIIYQSNMPLPKKNRLLRILQLETQSSEVRIGIAKYLNNINKKIVSFTNNEYNKFVYSLYEVLNDTKDYTCTSHDYNVICKYIDQHKGDYFIYKTRLIDYTTNDIPLYEDVMKIKDGNISSIKMASSEFDITVDPIFYTNIPKMINPFERGDIITLARNPYVFGIVNTRNEDWVADRNTHNEHNIANEYDEDAKLYNFTDEYIKVDMIGIECKITYENLNILELELLEEDDIDPDIYQKDLICMCSNLYKGKNVSLKNIFDEYNYLTNLN